MNAESVKKLLKDGSCNKQLEYIYVTDAVAPYAERLCEVVDGFVDTYGDNEGIRLFSAPGRTEIGGNHTDHQHGCVLAGSLNLDVIAAAAENGTNQVRILSKNYKMDVIDLDDLDIHPEQFDKAIALIRGVLKKFKEMGYELRGFDAYTMSNVLKGSGMSSSAAFEVIVGTIVNHLFANGEVNPVEIAKIGQFAENVYFNKPSGLMDQMACSVGNIIGIDFNSTEKPIVGQVDFDFAQAGHSLCIIDSGADHADLTDEYAKITVEMRKVAEFFGKNYLREVDKAQFMSKLAQVRSAVKSDRAILRAIHYFNDSERAVKEAEILKKGDFDGFLKLVKESGFSSYMYLQNIYAASQPEMQAVSLVLALCDEFLGERGAFRVHGGGFAGTVQAFVPNDMVDDFKKNIEAVIGENMCHILKIRPVGGVEIK